MVDGGLCERKTMVLFVGVMVGMVLSFVLMVQWRPATSEDIWHCIKYGKQITEEAHKAVKAVMSNMITPSAVLKSSNQTLGTKHPRIVQTTPPVPLTTETPTWKPRILCWVMCDPNDLEKRVKHVRDTWVKRCDKMLFMSSTENKTFPTIGLQNVQSGRSHIDHKCKTAWKYIYEHHLNDYDFFIKADPDTYIIVENMRKYLQSKNPNEPEIYGHRFILPGPQTLYISGGPGEVVTREALKRLVEKAFDKLKPDCFPDGEGEDHKICDCLQRVGGRIENTLDSKGRERFMVFRPQDHVMGNYPDWYYKYDINKAMKGANCCSEYPLGFHYVSPTDMYTLEYLIYKAKVFPLGTWVK